MLCEQNSYVEENKNVEGRKKCPPSVDAVFWSRHVGGGGWGAAAAAGQQGRPGPAGPFRAAGPSYT